jgi:hypothetical protein
MTSTIYWTAKGAKCGLRTGTILPSIGEDIEAMVAFLQMSDPGCWITLNKVNSDGTESFVDFGGKCSCPKGWDTVTA